MRIEFGLYRLLGLLRKPPEDGDRFLLAPGLELLLNFAGGLLEVLRRLGDRLTLTGGVLGRGGVLGLEIGDRFL